MDETGARRHTTSSPRRSRDRRGAALVELAIAVPILFLLLFGVIEFGAAFDKKIALNQGVREGARQAVVTNYTTANLVSYTKSRIGLNTSKTKVYVKVGSTAVGQPVTVCGSYTVESLTGLLSPFLGGKVLKSEVTMRIEQPATSLSTGGDAGDWSWCG
ncbi:MAG: pilus assembly protein [Acidimicrobiia bacterium]|nr:pilus assembly protein [Acidimicrobiia bacterium]